MRAVELDEAFDQFPDGLSVLTAVRDDGGRIVDFLAVYANPALERISGMPIADIVDHRLLDFVPAFREAAPSRPTARWSRTVRRGSRRWPSTASWAAAIWPGSSRCGRSSWATASS